MNDKFLLMIQTALETKGVKADYNKLKQMLDKDPAKINAVMDMSATKTQINKFIKEYAPQLQKMFSNIGVKVDLKDLESSMKSVFVESEKAVKQYQKEVEKAYQMNDSFDKKRSVNKQKIHQDELSAYKENEAFDKKQYLDREQAYKQNESNTRKMGLIEEQAYKENLNREKNLYLEKEQAYKTNESLKQKNIADDKKKYVDELSAYKTNEKLKQDSIKQTTKISQDALNLKSGKVQLDNNIAVYLKNNTKLSSDLKNKLTEIRSSIKSVDKTGLNNLKQEFKEVNSAAKSMSQVGKSGLDKFKSDLGNFTTFLGAGTVIMTGVNSIRQLVSTVIDLDKSLVNLQQATGFNIDKTKELLDTYIDLGQELGATGTEVADSADVWLRQGKSIADTNTLIRDSLILSKIGQIDSAQATTYLTSAMKGYKVEVSEVLGIVDKLSAVDLNSATSVSGLADAMSRTANGARIAGVEMDKLLGMLAVVGEVSQKSMDSVGESFKTIFARMGNVKLGKFVDEDGADITTEINDVEKILNKVDIKLRDSATSFRDYGNGLDDVGSDWSKFNDLEKSAIANAFAGVRQRENFIVLMENYGDSLKYAGISADSSGKALKKFSAYESSVEKKTKTLQASFQELSTDTLDSDVIKGFLDFANVLVVVVDKLGLFNIALVVTAGVLGGKGILPLIPLVSKAMVGLASSLGLAGTGAGVLVASLSAMLPVIVALGAIAGVAALYDHFNVTLKEHRENIEKLSGEYNSIKTELQGLQDELTLTGEKIDILNAKDNLTILEDGELDNLKQVNKELENRITLLNEEAGIKSGKLNEEIVSTFKSDFNNNDEFAYNTGVMQHDGSYSGEKVNKDEFTYFNEQVKLAEELIALGDKRTEQQNEELKNIKAYTTEVGNRISEDTKSFVVFDEETKKQKQTWEDLIDLSAKVADPAKWKQLKFDEIFNSEDFKKARYELEEMAKAGGLKPSDLYRSAEYVKLLSDTELSASEAAQQINLLTLATSENANVTANAEEMLKAYAEAIESLSSSESAFTNLKDEVKEFGAISMGTINSLIKDYPQLTDVLYDYLSGLKGTTDVISAMSGVYEIDMQNWQTLMLSKYENNEEFLNKVGGNNSDLINQMMTDYGIDISNNRSYLETKMDILNTYLGQAGGAWLKYYDIASGKTQNLGGLSAGDQYYISKQATLANEALATFNQGLDFSGIESTFETANGDFKTDSDTDKADKTDPAWLTKYNSDKADLDDKLAMDKINQEDYYKQFNDLNEAGFGKHKDEYLEQYRQNKQDIYKGQKQIDEDSIKSKFDSIDHDYAMGDIKTEAEYQKQKLDYAIKYYKGNADYQEEWKQAQEEYYKWVTEKDKETAQAKIDNMTSAQDAIIDSFKNAISDTADSASDMTGNEQYNKYSDAIKIASNEVEYLTDEMTKLNKMYKSGSIDEDTYTERLKTLKDALDEAKDSVDNIQDSMADAFSDNYNNVLDDLSDSYEKFTDKINDSYDAYEKLINAQKESLKAQKDANDYADDITDKTKDIADIQSDMATLKAAADTGDRDAINKLKDLQDELAKEQKDLTDTQEDHKLEVEENLLDTSLDNYKTITDKQIKDAETIYNTKLDNLKSLYAEEEKLISHASEYTQTEFASKMTALNTQIQGILASINNATNGSVSGVSSGITTGIVDTQNGIASNGSNNSGLSESTKNSILQILKNGTGKDYGNEASALNAYVRDKYGSPISNEQAVKVASLLKVGGISSTDDIKGNDVAKQKILDALLAAKFSVGGITKSIGEDGVAFVKRDELILNQGGTKIFTQDMIPLMKNFVNSFKLATPNLQNVITKSSSGNNVTVNMESLLSGVTISADYDILTAVKDNASKITEIIAKELR